MLATSPASGEPPWSIATGSSYPDPHRNRDYLNDLARAFSKEVSADDSIGGSTVMREHIGEWGAAIIGVDLKKSESVLIPPYDDADGVTEAFNLNLLRRMNNELGGDFRLSEFEHLARWNERDSPVEMHLVSRRTQMSRGLSHCHPLIIVDDVPPESIGAARDGQLPPPRHDIAGRRCDPDMPPMKAPFAST